jgi:hypothetical protein
MNKLDCFLLGVFTMTLLLLIANDIRRRYE